LRLAGLWCWLPFNEDFGGQHRVSGLVQQALLQQPQAPRVGSNHGGQNGQMAGRHGTGQVEGLGVHGFKAHQATEMTSRQALKSSSNIGILTTSVWVNYK
jgi:hypothetical protein